MVDIAQICRHGPAPTEEVGMDRLAAARATELGEAEFMFQMFDT